MKKGFSVIIVNYFSEKYIVPLAEELIKLPMENVEILIVSNSPAAFGWSDGYLRNNNIKIIQSDNNEGFGRAVNKGVALSQYDCFFMVNPDVKLDHSVLQKLYERLGTEDADTMAVSCTVKNEDGSLQRNYFTNHQLQLWPFFKQQMRVFLPSRFKAKRRRRIANAVLDQRFEVGGFYCSFVLMKKSLFDDIGGFDPDFFMYGEDIDLFRTRMPVTEKCVVYSDLDITHFGSKTDKYNLMDFQSQVSHLLYLRKVGLFYLLIYTVIRALRYFPLLLLPVSGGTYGRQKKVASGFFASLKYLGNILRAKRYGSLEKCLKIDAIPD